MKEPLYMRVLWTLTVPTPRLGIPSPTSMACKLAFISKYSDWNPPNWPQIGWNYPLWIVFVILMINLRTKHSYANLSRDYYINHNPASSVKRNVSRVEPLGTQVGQILLQFPEGKSLYDVDWIGVLSRRKKVGSHCEIVCHQDLISTYLSCHQSVTFFSTLNFNKQVVTAVEEAFL